MQNQNNSWFNRRFRSSIQQQSTSKENKNKKFNEINNELAKRLQTRRHEELERRYSFYNVENEIFEEPTKREEDNDNDFGNKIVDNFHESPEKKKRKFNHEEENYEGINNQNQENSIPNAAEERQEKETNIEDDIDNSLEDEEENEEELSQDDDEEELSQDDDEEEEQLSQQNEEKTESYDEEQGYELLWKSSLKKKRRIIEDEDEENEEEKGLENTHVHQQQNFITTDEDLFTMEDEVDKAVNQEVLIELQEEEAVDLEDDMEEGEEREEDLLTLTQQKRKDLFDDEADLSGDDFGSDADDIDQIDGLDEYEAEEGDLDELPEEEQIRDNLVRQYMKHQKDADDRKLLKLQEAFFADSDLHGKGNNGDRSFRLRMHDDSKLDWAKILGTVDDKEEEFGKEEEEGEEGSIWNERRAEMIKWKLEEEKKRQKQQIKDQEDEDDEFWQQQKKGQDEEELIALESELASEEGELFKLGEEILFGGLDNNDNIEDSNAEQTEKLASSSTSIPMPYKQPIGMFNRDSLLTKATCLENLLKEEKSEKSLPAPLFTAKKQKKL